MYIKNIKILLENRDFVRARKLLKDLLLVDKTNTDVLYLLSLAEAELGNVEEALDSLTKIITISPRHAAAHYTKANLLTALNNHHDALIHHDKSVTLLPSNPWSFINRGISRAALKNYEGAVSDFNKAIELDPELSAAFCNKGNVQWEAKLYEQSLESLDRAIDLDSLNVDALSGKSACLSKLNRSEEALVYANRAIELKPDYAQAWSNRGNALYDLNRHEEALASYEKSIELMPDDALAWSNRGDALYELKRHEEALASYEKSIEIKPDYALAWNNRGNALYDLKRHEEAVASYEKSIEIKPDYAEAWGNRGVVLNDIERHSDALISFERALELKPSGDLWLGSIVHTQMKICDWTNLEQRRLVLMERLLAGERASTPFAVLGLLDSPEYQRQCAQIYVKGRFDISSRLGAIIQRLKPNRIRIGYFSMDFRDHPVSHLTAELFELHDRSKFEIYAFSFGVNTGDSVRQHIEKTVDKFFDVSHLGDVDIARLSRESQIDIAIDLGGHTRDARPRIFAERAAPIQINYLGYPGTWGANCMDYIIGDAVTISEENREFFSEKVIFLPNSFQVNPSQRPLKNDVLSREVYGLPNESFVFCCFNNVWKITPEVFGLWMRILRRVPKSVLWLYAANSASEQNLKLEAEKRGVSANRIIFAGRAQRGAYLAQFLHADLFLDTFPYNAGTTASDALWVGLPILTQSGKSFVSKMAASLLKNIGLSELIAYSEQEYCSRAIELALNPLLLASIRAQLAQNRLTASLFDTELFAKHIESAYRATFDRYHVGLPPDDIYVKP